MRKCLIIFGGGNMKIIECLSESIEETLDAAEDSIKKAIYYKTDYPIAAKAFFTKSVVLMDNIKVQHDAAAALIEEYKKEKGEPPEGMLAIYNYMHGRHISKAVAIKSLQDMYVK